MFWFQESEFFPKFRINAQIIEKNTHFQMNRKGKVLSNGKKEKYKAYFVNGISIFDNHSESGR